MQSIVMDGFKWFDTQLSEMKHGEIGLRFIIHDGIVKRIDREKIEKGISIKVKGDANRGK